jgi:hypothetical protein
MISAWSSDHPAFQEKRKIIERYITSYGLEVVGPGDIHAPEYEKKFIPAVHEGFAKGQKEILAGLIEIEKERAALKARLKLRDSKRPANDTRKEVDHALARLDEAEAILRKLADTIAWQLLGNQLWLARRLNTDDAPPSLLHSNVQSYVQFTDQFNAENPMGFALISDLTSFVRLGDILARDGELHALHVLELKEGKVNDELLPLAQFAAKTKCEHLVPNFEKTESPKKVQQLKRLIRQTERLEQTQELINTGIGQDARGDRVRLSEDVMEECLYADRLAELIEQSQSSNWAIDVIDGCLFVGVYRGHFRDGLAFQMWLKESDVDGPICDLRTTLFAPLGTPLYLIPPLFSHVEDIHGGNVRVLFCLSLSHFVSLFEEYGLKVGWLEPKESAEFNPKASHQLLLRQGRVMTLNLGGFTSHVGIGILSRMFYNFMMPTTVVEMLGSNLVLAKRYHEAAP